MAATEKNQDLIKIARGMKNIPWCEDYEKMISGMLYNSLVPELEAGRFSGRRFCHKYNTYFPAEDDTTANFASLAATREKMLQSHLGAVGEGAFIEPPFTVDYGCNVRLGSKFYANFNLTILDCSLVTIGHRAMFGPNVSIFAATHEVEVQSRRDYIEYAAPVTIGDDCWIGGHVVILPGVTIGDGVTVAAGSIVTRDIPSWSVVRGAPAKVVKKVTPLERMPGDEKPFSAVEEMAEVEVQNQAATS